MKTLKYISIFAALTIWGATLGSCSNFEELNQNPNQVSYGNIKPTKLLQNIIYSGNWVVYYRSWRLNSELMQYSVQTNALEHAANYEIKANDPLQLWNGLYRWASNANHMYSIAAAQGDYNCMAIALTMKVYYAEYITAIFGDIPYSEAFKWAEGVSHPAFDTQEQIYSRMLLELEEANALYDTSAELDYPSRDLLYNGDLNKWQKFTNSLRMRLLMRVSRTTEIDAAAQIRKMLSDPQKYPMFESNSDAAILYFSGVNPFFNQFGTMGSTDPMNQNTRLGKTLTDILNAVSDPRRPYYADINSSEYEGLLSGQNADYIAENLGSTVTYAKSLSANTSPSTLMNYAELLFIKAEAAWRGMIDADAQTYYEAAVTASVRQYCGEDFQITAMLANTAAKYNGTLLQIMQQKYVAQFLVGYEAWCDYRRTSLPEMPKGPAMGNRDIYGAPTLPTRFVYPAVTQTTNYDNYRQAVDRMGGEDNMLNMVWWASGTKY